MPKHAALLALALFPLLASLAISSPSHVVISEIQLAGATATDEFVELYNPTDSSVDLSGWRLSKKTASGTQSNLATTLSGTIPAQGYFLITHPAGYTGTITPDAIYSTSSSIAADNTVILYSDAGTTTIDLVGMGAASIFESSATQNPPAHQSIQRTAGQDTDNNASDFILTQTSDPQNSQFVPPASPSPTPSPSQAPPGDLASPSPSPTPSNEPSPSPSVAPSPSPLPTPEPSIEPSPSPEPSLTPSPTPEPSPTPSPTPTPVPSPTAPPSPSPSAIPTPSPSPTPQPSPSPTDGHIVFSGRFVTCRLSWTQVSTRLGTFSRPTISCTRTNR